MSAPLIQSFTQSVMCVDKKINVFTFLKNLHFLQLPTSAVEFG